MAKAKKPAPKKKTLPPIRPKTKTVPPAKPKGPELRAIRSVIYQVSDLARAKAYYGALLGKTPYFDQPFYCGYDIDGQELGLHPDVSRIPPGPGGAIAYWRVDDLYAAWEHALSQGGDPIEPPHNVGKGTDVAIIADPFGNYVGLIQVV